MGCGGSSPLEATPGESAHTRPLRTPPLPNVEPNSCKLVLTTRGSRNQLIFDRAEELGAGCTHVPLTLRSHPGMALVRRETDSGPFGPWVVAPLGIGSARNAVTATFEHGEYLAYSHGTAARKVLDIAHWNNEVGNDVNFVGHHSNRRETYKQGGGRSFVVNADGTLGAKHAPHLVLGTDYPDCTLVTMHDVVNKIVLDAHVADALRNGRTTPLTLASHPGFAIVPKTEEPRRIHEWGVNYQHLGVGPTVDGMMTSYPLTARLEGPFLVSQYHTTREYVFDVPFGNLNEHCAGEHGKLPIAALFFDHGNNKEDHNAARLFVLNNDNTISPQRAAHLVFGIRGDLPPLPEGGAGTAAVPTAQSVPVQVPMAQPVVGATVVATPVAAVAVTAVPMGMPVEAQAGSSSSPPPLHEMVAVFRRELSITESAMPDVVDAACEKLGLSPKGMSLLDKATACWQLLQG